MSAPGKSGSRNASRRHLGRARGIRLVPVLALLSAFPFLHSTAAQPASPVTALAFSPDGRTLASAGRGSITLRSIGSADPVRVLATGLSKITSLAFHPTPGLLAAAGGTPGSSGAAALVDCANGNVVARCGDGADVARAAYFDPAGRRLVVAVESLVRVYTLDRGKASLQHDLKGHVGPVLGVAFSPDGRWLVSVGSDRSVKLWSADQGQLVRSFDHHTEPVQAIAFRPQIAPASGPIVCATAGDDRTVRIWQPALGRMVRTVRGHAGAILTLGYAMDGRTLFTAGSEGIVRRIDADSDTLQHSWRASDDWIYSLAVSVDGQRLATGDWHGVVRVWTPDGTEVRSYPAHAEEEP